MSAHTKGPWRVDAHRLTISAADGNIGLLNLARPDEVSSANAAFIVRACNSHDALVSALKACVSELPDRCEHEREMARAAIAKAEGTLPTDLKVRA